MLRSEDYARHCVILPRKRATSRPFPATGTGSLHQSKSCPTLLQLCRESFSQNELKNVATDSLVTERQAQVLAEVRAELPSLLQVTPRGVWTRSLLVACVLLLILGLGAIVLRPKVLAKHSGEGSTY